VLSLKGRLILAAAVLCALPAQGANPTLSDDEVHVLTQVDAMPTREGLDEAFQPTGALARLPTIASDDAHDLGVQLRAIPAYCPSAAGACGPETPSHDVLVDLIARYRDATDAEQAPQNTLRLRAAVEALGATRSGLPEDVDLLLTLLGDGAKRVDGHPSLDVRAAAVAAVGELCNPDAKDVLFPYLFDPSPQVVAKVRDALRDLELCSLK